MRRWRAHTPSLEYTMKVWQAAYVMFNNMPRVANAKAFLRML